MVLIVGIIIGAGIFRVPADVAAGAQSAPLALGLWAVGGLAALAGALCYAELASRFPSIGGEYHFLRLAWGPRLAAWFVWARLAVIQTGSIAAVAFVAGDQLQAIWPSGPTVNMWAVLSLILVTGVALTHLEMTTRLQQLLQAAVLFAIFAIIGAALVMPPAAAPAVAETASAGPTAGALGMTLVFVMLAYGGWNEAAYLSAEVKDRRAITRALIGGILLVGMVYLALNAALLHALGIDGLASSTTPGVDVARAAFGPAGSVLIALAATAAAVSTMNTSAITGARAMCALGQDLPLVSRIGQWDQNRSVPTAALLLQTAVTLALMLYAATAPDGFAAMVAFGAPVFWLFLSLTALSLFRLRKLYPDRQGFTVPLYPILPLIFVAACLYMLWSGLNYAAFMFNSNEGGRMAGLLGTILLVAGLPLALRAGRAGD